MGPWLAYAASFRHLVTRTCTTPTRTGSLPRGLQLPTTHDSCTSPRGGRSPCEAPTSQGPTHCSIPTHLSSIHCPSKMVAQGCPATCRGLESTVFRCTLVQAWNSGMGRPRIKGAEMHFLRTRTAVRCQIFRCNPSDARVAIHAGSPWTTANPIP